MQDKKKVILALSGGVDSSVAAHLLLQQNYHVEALYMKNWDSTGDTHACPHVRDYLDAQAICHKLDIPLHQVNFTEEYWTHVFAEFLRQLELGLTPNPDVLCNKAIKFSAFVSHAKRLGADMIATGHYARRLETPDGPQLYRGIDTNKDQSYFLHQLDQTQIANSLFPIGSHEKPSIRALAKTLQLRTHNKKDSTGICFIGARNFRQFIQRYLPVSPGPIVDDTGRRLGTHDGLVFYTIGQRQGLPLGDQCARTGQPRYVAAKEMKTNTLVVVEGHDHPLLHCRKIIIDNIHWVSGISEPSAVKTAKTRYRQRDATCRLLTSNECTTVVFDTPQRAVTPGQYCVLYHGSRCLGGGPIVSSIG